MTARDVERAKPLAPIRLWPTDGHILPEPWRRAPVKPTDPQPLADADPLPDIGAPIGEHALCGGIVVWHRTSETSRAIICHYCFMRFNIPNPVTTWGELREFCRATFYPNDHLPQHTAHFDGCERQP